MLNIVILKCIMSNSFRYSAFSLVFPGNATGWRHHGPWLAFSRLESSRPVQVVMFFTFFVLLLYFSRLCVSHRVHDGTRFWCYKREGVFGVVVNYDVMKKYDDMTTLLL